MDYVHQSPQDPGFVQNPYPFYAQARTLAPLVYWEDYAMPAAFGYDPVARLLKDKRFGREIPAEQRIPPPEHLTALQAIEDHSLLEIEPPRHTRLRALILRAFTSRRVNALAPSIQALCHSLIDAFPDKPFDLIPAYCTQVPVLTIARLLGVPEAMAPQFLTWSHAMVAMYQAGRNRQIEERANKASQEFAAYLDGYIEERRTRPGDDLISALIAAEQHEARLSGSELITTLILLLNAGHEATVHALGNGLKQLLQNGWQQNWLADNTITGLIEEVLRFDPPLHMFTRYAYEDIEIFDQTLSRGDQVALMLGAANRDPQIWADPDVFDPGRPVQTQLAFGSGIHFCVGAPLARLEMQIALQTLFARCPHLKLEAAPTYGNTYHFHGLTGLTVST
ncbi:MAG: cytochrome P450 [Arenibacterium sp.]